jgi:glyceraldehyde 3-phosphate dehydrogenase
LLDSVPKAGAKDLRRSRSSLNSIILTSSNAAHALEEVIPEIREIGFMADSVRIPIPTLSLIILNLTFQTQIEADGRASVNNVLLNQIYREAAAGTQKGQLVYSEEQNVPADVVGMRAAVVIEAAENHTRTGFVDFDLGRVPDVDPKMLAGLNNPIIRVPVTHAKIFGWYDNEYGSYTNMLGDLTVHVHRTLD